LLCTVSKQGFYLVLTSGEQRFWQSVELPQLFLNFSELVFYFSKENLGPKHVISHHIKNNMLSSNYIRINRLSL
jgi:hypothetical protein